jgi:hypothetical protein
MWPGPSPMPVATGAAPLPVPVASLKRSHGGQVPSRLEIEGAAGNWRNSLAELALRHLQVGHGVLRTPGGPPARRGPPVRRVKGPHPAEDLPGPFAGSMLAAAAPASGRRRRRALSSDSDSDFESELKVRVGPGASSPSLGLECATGTVTVAADWTCTGRLRGATVTDRRDAEASANFASWGASVPQVGPSHSKWLLLSWLHWHFKAGLPRGLTPGRAASAPGLGLPLPRL